MCNLHSQPQNIGHQKNNKNIVRIYIITNLLTEVETPIIIWKIPTKMYPSDSIKLLQITI